MDWIVIREMSRDSNPKPSSAAAAPPPSVKLVGVKDLVVMLKLPVLAAVSWFLPESLWPRVVAAIALIYSPLSNARFRARKEHVESCLRGTEVAASPEAIVRALVRGRIEAIIQNLRHYRPGGWRPTIHLVGREHVTAAQERGQGVVLWVSHFIHHPLVAKMAFHQAGFAVNHLTHPRHGFSASRFGVRFLNPIQTTVEDRFLEARVSLALDSAAKATATLRRCLEAGGVVSVTVGNVGRRPVDAPFLGGRLRLAVGAPNLALTTGAALLPVFPIREPGGDFTVTIAPPIAFEPGAERGEALKSAAYRYARMLESYVAEHPEQWDGWLACLG
jgi:lauroyl/myristoyl acyltransferase